MKRWIVLVPVLLVLACAGARRPIPEEVVVIQPEIPELTQELRGVWVTRFDWVRKNPDETKDRIRSIMETVSDANMNAVFFQVRGAAETLYPSPLETWSVLLDESDPGFDPMAFAIQEAHAHNLQFHAYINLMTLYAGDDPPDDPDHLYYRHGPHVAADSSWVLFDSTGHPMEKTEYYYLNPALTDVKSHLKSVIRHVTETYNLDGLHFDRIRYPGEDYLHDPISEKIFKQDSSLTPMDRPEWARRILTDLVEDVVAEALLIKPYLQISSATWGLYRTADLPGYEHFNSGYATYFQDAIDWLDRGIMDFIVPMIYWDNPDPKPNFDDLWLDFAKRTPHFRSILPGMIAKTPWIEGTELLDQINWVRRHEGRGHVIFSYSALQGQDEFVQTAYPSPIAPPDLKRTREDRVVSLNLPDVLSDPVAVSHVPASGSLQHRDGEGWIGMILDEHPDTLTLSGGPYTLTLSARAWRPPYQYRVDSLGRISRREPWVEWRRFPQDTTHRSIFPLLCKSATPVRAFIEEDSCHQYQTGVFFKDVLFREGPNRIRSSVVTPEGQTAFYEKQIVYRPVDPRRPALPLWVDSSSVKPSSHLVLPPSETITLRIEGSLGQRAKAIVNPGSHILSLSRQDRSDYSVYQTDLHLSRLQPDSTYRIDFVLESVDEKLELRYHHDRTLRIQGEDRFPLVQTTENETVMSYNLGPIRLGGPIISELDSGVVLQSSGNMGRYIRIQLDSRTTGFIRASSLDTLALDRPRPHYYLRSIGVRPSAETDVVSIPCPEPVPYAVFPEPHLNRIRVALYGVETSSTWITHRTGLKVVDEVTWQQPLPTTYEVLIHLKTPHIWGYRLNRSGSMLTLKVKHPPAVTRTADSLDVSGLKVALEAGHGGSNWGAVGLSGLKEKTINLDVAQRLEVLCTAAGMEVLQIRPDDRNMSLTEKRNAARDWDADICVSIHANATGSRGGYLRVEGTSTYYHNPFWKPFARNVYQRLLELPLEEFGTVGSFNYKVIRQSEQPTILVEQAFMSHAEDEEKLFSDRFRQELAEKVFAGMLDTIGEMVPEPESNEE